MEFLHWVLVNKVNWIWLSSNHNAIYILEENLNKVDWELLSGNVNAVHILVKHLDKVRWMQFLKNPSIFVEWNGMK